MIRNNPARSAGLILVVLLCAFPTSGAELVPGDILVLTCSDASCDIPEKQVVRVDPDTGERTILTSGGYLTRPSGLAQRCA